MTPGTREWDLEGLAAEAEKRIRRQAGKAGKAPEAVPTARTVRYYVAEGIVSPPSRRGRSAMYGHRQLLQLLAARQLASAGLSIKQIVDQVGDADEQQLERLLKDRESAMESVVETAVDPKGRLGSPDRARELAEVMQRLGCDDRRRPLFTSMARLSIAPWCQLYIDRSRLRKLSADEARDIAFAIAGALMDPEIRRLARGEPTAEQG